MSINPEHKKELIKKFAINDRDTGSPEVRIALFSEHIKNVSAHLETHPKDIHSRRGLLKMVNQRRKLLAYVKGKSLERYQKIIQALGLRK